MKPSKTQINKILMESSFDPRKVGPMSIVVGLEDPNYSETRAIELIKEAQKCSNDFIEYNIRVRQAISLLALARVQRGAIRT